jgi:hypothetical protein
MTDGPPQTDDSSQASSARQPVKARVRVSDFSIAILFAGLAAVCAVSGAFTLMLLWVFVAVMEADSTLSRLARRVKTQRIVLLAWWSALGRDVLVSAISTFLLAYGIARDKPFPYVVCGVFACITAVDMQRRIIGGIPRVKDAGPS